MRIIWNDQTLAWFNSSSEYTGYNRKLSEILLERLPDRHEVCDFGCGLGLIDFELAPHFEHVHCVDILPEAIERVNRHIKETGTQNITTQCIDINDLEDSYDNVIALYNGGGSFLKAYYPHAKNVFIFITHDTDMISIGPEGKKARHPFNVGKAEKILDEHQVNYTLEHFSIEYGQPFTDLDDARQYIMTYSLASEGEELENYINTEVVKTDDPVYPYYLPKWRRFGLFTIKRADNPHLEGKDLSSEFKDTCAHSWRAGRRKVDSDK